MTLELHKKADFRKIDRLWGFDLVHVLQHIGTIYGSYFDLPKHLAEMTEQALSGRTNIYLIGGGPYSRLPVGGDRNGMCDYPMAACEFDTDETGIPEASIFLAPFPISNPKTSWAVFGYHRGEELSREQQARLFGVFYRSQTLTALYHESGHLFTKYVRAMRGQPEPSTPANSCSDLFEEAACMFYTDANYDWEIKPFRLNENAAEIWGNAVREFGPDAARNMFLDHNYSRLLSREDYTELADQWKNKLIRTKATSTIAA